MKSSNNRPIFVTTEARSAMMSNMRSTNTIPELLLRKALWKAGLRYRLNVKNLPGRPDIVMPKYKLAIFVDGEFWHGHNWDIVKNKIKSNKEYWIPKIERNMQRDEENNVSLKALGYIVLRFWAKDVLKNIEECVSAILNHI